MAASAARSRSKGSPRANRWAAGLGRQDSGVYAYAIFSHPMDYPNTQIGESRFGAKLNGQVFDWLSIDAQRNEPMPTGADWEHGSRLNMKRSAPADHGRVGGPVGHSRVRLGGPTHVELTGHLDDNNGGDPTLLD